jgi:hypothetical protein
VGKITDRIPPGSDSADGNGVACDDSFDRACNPLLPGGGGGTDRGGSGAGGSRSSEDESDLPRDETDDARAGSGPRGDDEPDVDDEDDEPAGEEESDAGVPPDDPPDVDDEPSVADAGGDAEAPVSFTPLFTFDDNAQGWALVSAEPAALLAASSLGHDATSGLTASGSLISELPFDDASQQLSAQVTLGIPLNLEGRSVALSIRLEDGVLGSDDARLDARVEARTGPSGLLASGVETGLATGQLTTLVLSLDTPANVDGAPAEHDAGDVRAIGLRLSTGADGTYLPGLVRIDDVVVF